jgi:hypothetical protein
MQKTNSATLKITTAFFALILCTQISSAQWIMYNFSPQAAYQASYGLTTNTNPSSTNIQANGWPTNWNNATNRGILAVQFSTNTNTPNVMTCLQPLIYTYSTNTNTLTTTNYFTNAPQISLTNTNVTGASSLSNACYILRANYSTNSVYMAGQYSLVLTNAGTNVGTNTVGTFNSICVRYTTNNIGTNGVPTGTNYYPAILQLKVSSISGTNVTNVLNQQLILPLSINTALTRIVNTNTNFGTNGTPIPTNNIYTNLVKCIRSNSTYTNF